MKKIYIYSFLFGFLLGAVAFFGPLPWGGFFLGGQFIADNLVENIINNYATKYTSLAQLNILAFSYSLLLAILWFILLILLKKRLRLNKKSLFSAFFIGVLGIGSSAFLAIRTIIFAFSNFGF